MTTWQPDEHVFGHCYVRSMLSMLLQLSFLICCASCGGQSFGVTLWLLSVCFLQRRGWLQFDIDSLRVSFFCQRRGCFEFDIDLLRVCFQSKTWMFAIWHWFVESMLFFCQRGGCLQCDFDLLRVCFWFCQRRGCLQFCIDLFTVWCCMSKSWMFANWDWFVESLFVFCQSLFLSVKDVYVCNLTLIR